jgi:hypothetical protein
MRLYAVTFGESDVVEIEPGVEVGGADGRLAADLGTDVGGATLAMVPLRIPLVDFGDVALELANADGRERLLGADLRSDEDGLLSFAPVADATDARAFVVLSVIQRSPDARTEVLPYADGVECVGNAFDRPMDTQVLVMRPGGRVQFRRFGRGGHFGPWQALAWDGASLTATAAHESAE